MTYTSPSGRLIKVEDDGTRVYSNGYRYKPLALKDRTHAVLKPEDPRARRFYGQWFLPLELLEMGKRVMPQTRPDSDAYRHRWKMPLCACEVCRRPQAEKYKLRATRYFVKHGEWPQQGPLRH